MLLFLIYDLGTLFICSFIITNIDKYTYLLLLLYIIYTLYIVFRLGENIIKSDSNYKLIDPVLKKKQFIVFFIFEFIFLIFSMIFVLNFYCEISSLFLIRILVDTPLSILVILFSYIPNNISIKKIAKETIKENIVFLLILGCLVVYFRNWLLDISLDYLNLLFFTISPFAIGKSIAKIIEICTGHNYMIGSEIELPNKPQSNKKGEINTNVNLRPGSGDEIPYTSSQPNSSGVLNTQQAGNSKTIDYSTSSTNQAGNAQGKTDGQSRLGTRKRSLEDILDKEEKELVKEPRKRAKSKSPENLGDAMSVLGSDISTPRALIASPTPSRSNIPKGLSQLYITSQSNLPKVTNQVLPRYQSGRIVGLNQLPTLSIPQSNRIIGLTQLPTDPLFNRQGYIIELRVVTDSNFSRSNKSTPPLTNTDPDYSGSSLSNQVSILENHAGVRLGLSHLNPVISLRDHTQVSKDYALRYAPCILERLASDPDKSNVCIPVTFYNNQGELDTTKPNKKVVKFIQPHVGNIRIPPRSNFGILHIAQQMGAKFDYKITDIEPTGWYYENREGKFQTIDGDEITTFPVKKPTGDYIQEYTIESDHKNHNIFDEEALNFYHKERYYIRYIQDLPYSYYHRSIIMPPRIWDRDAQERHLIWLNKYSNMIYPPHLDGQTGWSINTTPNWGDIIDDPRDQCSKGFNPNETAQPFARNLAGKLKYEKNHPLAIYEPSTITRKEKLFILELLKHRDPFFYVELMKNTAVGNIPEIPNIHPIRSILMMAM
jgi:hypothetical protein